MKVDETKVEWGKDEVPPRLPVGTLVKCLDRFVLQTMVDCSPGDPTEWAFGFGYLGDGYVHRDIIRGVCRSLTERGFCIYRRSLFNDDGEVAGSGYGITREGIEYYKTLIEGEKT